MILAYYTHLHHHFDSFFKPYFTLFIPISHIYTEYVILFIVKISDIGEFGLISRLDKMIASAGADRFNGDLLIGIGDDCAAWKCTGKVQLATVDSMVEGVHFTLDTAAWREIGWKSLAINLSDIAAMGGVPRYALINLALPQDTHAEDVFQLYQGMIELAKQTKTAIVGGNISRAPQVSITITVIGESADGQILRRSAAKPGDVIAVTGWPGSAAGGLAVLRQNLQFDKESMSYFHNAFLHPTPRLKEGELLLKNGIKAAIDTSDGLLSDLRHICEASGVGARINVADIPLHEFLKKHFKEQALEMALSGGEDYELLFTGSAGIVNKVQSRLKIPVHIIGEITAGEPGKIEIMDTSGKPVDIKKTGWTHF
jgi:thiamine-monophosphate kinase